MQPPLDPLNPATRAAFTLVEMSIVMVVIALLVAGIVFGKEMIYTAKIRRFASQMEAIESAIATFQSRYYCTPGDCSRASSFGLGANGNGDRHLEDDNPRVWKHLANAGLIDPGVSHQNFFQTALDNVQAGIAGGMSGRYFPQWSIRHNRQ